MQQAQQDKTNQIITGSDGASLEAIADKLLKDSHSAFGDCPAYSEKYLNARSRRRGETSLDEIIREYGALPPCVDEILEVAWTEVVSGAHKVGCSERQISAMTYRRSGLTVTEISVYLKCSPRTVNRDLRTATAKIQHIPAFGLWSVIAEVFHLPVWWIRNVLVIDREK